MKCPIHNVDMKHYSNERGEWDSHKLDDGKWCNGKDKSERSALEAKVLASINTKLDKVLDRLDKMALFFAKGSVPAEPKDEDVPF